MGPRAMVGRPDREAEQMKHRDTGILPVAVVVTALVYPFLARADTRPSRELVHAVARICVSEASFARTDDCAAIVEVLRNRATRLGRSMLGMARAYAPRATGRRAPRGARQAWVAALTLDLAEPAPWRAYNAARAARGLLPIPWTRYRPAWAWRIAEAEDLLRHPRRVCEDASVLHWGARYGVDWERAQRMGWIEVRCGTSSRNAFWRLPGGRAGDVAEAGVRLGRTAL